MSSRVRIVVYLVVLALTGGSVYAYPSVRMWLEIRSIPPAVNRQVSYAADVAPILEEHCYRCHGDGRSKGGLRFENREELLRGGISRPAVVESDSAGSALIHRVARISGVNPMPPGENARLTKEQIGVLRAWIDQDLSWSGTS